MIPVLPIHRKIHVLHGPGGADGDAVAAADAGALARDARGAGRVGLDEQAFGANVHAGAAAAALLGDDADLRHG